MTIEMMIGVNVISTSGRNLDLDFSLRFEMTLKITR